MSQKNDGELAELKFSDNSDKVSAKSGCESITPKQKSARNLFDTQKLNVMQQMNSKQQSCSNLYAMNSFKQNSRMSEKDAPRMSSNLMQVNSKMSNATKVDN